jgi:aspartyl-tRNA(Asn)/glutamyl-tRNA(Gln) amidotransferase subunit B
VQQGWVAEMAGQWALRVGADVVERGVAASVRQMIAQQIDDLVSSTGAQELFAALLDDGREPGVLAGELNLLQVSDAGALEPVVAQVLAGHPRQVALYLDGKDSLIGFFIGQVMRAFPGSPDPKLVRALLAERLAEMQP